MTVTIDVGRAARHALLVFLLLGASLAIVLGYHFYWPTSVTVGGHRVNRVQLIDWMIDRELQRK